MESGHSSSSLLSASSTEVVMDTDRNDSASLACVTATPPSVQGRSSTLSLFPVPKVSMHQCCSFSTVSPASAQSYSPSSEHFSHSPISARGHPPSSTLPTSGASSQAHSPTFSPGPTQSHSCTPEASRSPSPVPGQVRFPVSVLSRSGRNNSPTSRPYSPIPSQAHSSFSFSSGACSLSPPSGSDQVFSRGLLARSSSVQGGPFPY